MIVGATLDDETVSASVDPATVNLNSGDNEDVDFQITLDDESETEAGEHCFILRATVTNDPTNGAEDNLTLTGVVPQIRTCEEALDWSFANLQPGQTSLPNNFQVTNTGNTAWTAAVQAQSAGGEDISGWVSLTLPQANSLNQIITETGSHLDLILHQTHL